MVLALDFLSLLLTIEIAVFGIISAVVLVFVQLVYTNFSYKHIGGVLANWRWYLFVSLGILDLLLTSAGIFYFTFDWAAYSPAIAAALGPAMLSAGYAFACWLLLLLATSGFAAFFADSLPYLQPHRALFLVARRIRHEHLRDYLEDRGVRADAKVTPGATSSAEDPLLPLQEMMIQFIHRDDLKSLSEASRLLLRLSRGFIEAISPKTGEDTSRLAELQLAFGEHQTDLITAVLEIAQRERLESAQLLVMDYACRLVETMSLKGSYFGADLVLKLIERVGDHSIGKSPAIFHKVIEFYQDLGELILKIQRKLPNAQQSGRDPEWLLDQIFRTVGWLAERLLKKTPPEDAPLMLNVEYATDYDTVMNCVLGFGWRYAQDQPQGYPLLYFDCVRVLILKIASIKRQGGIARLSQDIYSLGRQFISFAEAAIAVGNAKGAALAAIKITQVYGDLKDADLEEDARDVIGHLVKIGIMAACSKEQLHVEGLLDKSLELWVIEELANAGEDVEGAVKEAYYHSLVQSDHEAVWRFITTLGGRLRRNFGFMFDHETGEHFPPDDPRRR